MSFLSEPLRCSITHVAGHQKCSFVNLAILDTGKSAWWRGAGGVFSKGTTDQTAWDGVHECVSIVCGRKPKTAAVGSSMGQENLFVF